MLSYPLVEKPLQFEQGVEEQNQGEQGLVTSLRKEKCVTTVAVCYEGEALGLFQEKSTKKKKQELEYPDTVVASRHLFASFLPSFSTPSRSVCRLESKIAPHRHILYVAVSSMSSVLCQLKGGG